MTITSVTFLCFCSNLSGRLSNAFKCTFLVVLPLSDPKLGPSISSAHIMSYLLIGRFGSILPSTYLVKSLLDGCPIMSCMDRAFTGIGIPFNSVLCLRYKKTRQYSNECKEELPKNTTDLKGTSRL